MRKFNPCLQNLVDNHRRRLKECGLDASAYSDLELFAVIEYWTGMESNDEENEAIDCDVLRGTKR